MFADFRTLVLNYAKDHGSCKDTLSPPEKEELERVVHISETSINAFTDQLATFFSFSIPEGLQNGLVLKYKQYYLIRYALLPKDESRRTAIEQAPVAYLQTVAPAPPPAVSVAPTSGAEPGTAGRSRSVALAA